MRIREDAIKDVEIVEPPIQELTKKNNWIGKAFISGCGCLFIFIVALLVVFKLFVGPGPKEIRQLPDNFPKAVPVYDAYNIDRIIHIPGRYKARAMEIAAFFPKIILSPLFLNTADSGDKTEPVPTSQRPGIFREFWRVLTEPVGDDRDTVQIEWRRVSGNPDSVIQYYKNKLGEQNFSLESVSRGDNFEQITFERDDEIGGTVFAQRSPDAKEKIIDYAFIIVNYPETAVTGTVTSTKQ